MANSATINKTISYGQTIAFSAYGLILKQKEVTEVTEIRAYTSYATAKAAAEGYFSDTSTQITLYHTTDGGGFVMASVMGGSIQTATASRVSEAGFYTVTVTKITYDNTGSHSGWTTTRPAAGAGFVSGISRTKRGLTNVEGNQLWATETHNVREWRGCTAAEAASLVANCPADSLTDQTYKCMRIATEIGRYVAQVGTRYSTDSRYISDAEGYSVTRTTTTITVSGSNWVLVT